MVRTQNHNENSVQAQHQKSAHSMLCKPVLAVSELELVKGGPKSSGLIVPTLSLFLFRVNCPYSAKLRMASREAQAFQIWKLGLVRLEGLSLNEGL